ncbi:hypothetical protein HNP84_006760 [Thermocatellispora tengchongensis]|uniref:Uncharacterized protein n=1 Tax=Thermocatellispora tengchongensis TaxID=1073253 RepID=A0A840PBI8_9ACTN|nr:hypothetical protein [Thermocatellispora tengchongensis]MBB5137008.1 hypothetical protein [Thermocatellispora tengchongensis]
MRSRRRREPVAIHPRAGGTGDPPHPARAAEVASPWRPTAA